jgi:hypothetical protein
LGDSNVGATARQKRFALIAALAAVLLFVAILAFHAVSDGGSGWRAKLEAWLASPEFAAAKLPAPDGVVPPDDAAAIFETLRDPRRRELLRCALGGWFPTDGIDRPEFEDACHGVQELLASGSAAPERRALVEAWVEGTSGDVELLVRAARAPAWKRDALERTSTDAMRVRQGIARQAAWQFHVRAVLAAERGDRDGATALVEHSFALAELGAESCTVFEWLLHLEHERECLDALHRLRRQLGPRADLRRFACFLDPIESRHRAARALRREIVLQLETVGVLANGRVAGAPRSSDPVERVRGALFGDRDLSQAFAIYDTFLAAFDSTELDPFSALPTEKAMINELPTGAMFSAAAAPAAARMAAAQAGFEARQRAAEALLAPSEK